ncbi:hypothetical protein [Cellulomonas soli]
MAAVELGEPDLGGGDRRAGVDDGLLGLRDVVLRRRGGFGGGHRGGTGAGDEQRRDDGPGHGGTPTGGPTSSGERGA